MSARAVALFLILLVLALLLGLLIAPIVAAAPEASTFYLPVVTTSTYAHAWPAPGDYSLDQYMSIQVRKPGCIVAMPEFGPGAAPDSYAAYHPECRDGVATLLISFYKPIEIDGITLDVMLEDGTSYQTQVDWQGSFGK